MTATLNATTQIREGDLRQHIEDDIKVNAIHDGRLVEVYWNEPTEERWAAYSNMFSTY